MIYMSGLKIKKYVDLSESIRLEIRDSTNKKVVGKIKHGANDLTIKKCISSR